MNTKEIYLKVKGWFEDKISTRLNSALKKITPMFGKVAQGIGGLTSMLPSMDGALNKVSAGINGLVAGFLSLGPAGVVLAGISVAVGIITDKIYGAAEAAKNLHEKHLAAMQERLRQLKADEIEKLDKAISKAADDADRAAKAFDAMAAAYMKVAQAKDATSAAGDAADISALALERQQAMNAAGSENEAAAIGVGYDVAIAQRRLAAATDQQSAAVERAAEQAADDAERAAASDKAVADARNAYLLALKKQNEAENMEAVAPDVLKARNKSVEQARKNLEAAEMRRTAAYAQQEASAEAVKQAELRRAAAIDDATAAVENAERAEAKLLESQILAERAEYERLELEAEKKAAEERQAAERAVADARKREADSVRASIAEQEKQRSFFESELSNAAQELTNAWHLYRDKSAMQAVMDEEKAQKQAEKDWAKDFASLKSRRRDWRTAENLNVDDRATREVALAKERKDQAERSLVEIAENTRRTREQLESLLTMKGGE